MTPTMKQEDEMTTNDSLRATMTNDLEQVMTALFADPSPSEWNDVRDGFIDRWMPRTVTPPAPQETAGEAVAWRVKPLEWQDPSETNNWVHVAKTAFGEYYVSIDGGSHTAWLEAHVKPYENLLGPAVGSVYEAKDQAQADYAARILAMLHPTPAAAPTDNTALVEAYEAGAKAVHQEWKRVHPEPPPRGEPDFSEAASDYAALSTCPAEATSREGVE